MVAYINQPAQTSQASLGAYLGSYSPLIQSFLPTSSHSPAQLQRLSSSLAPPSSQTTTSTTAIIIKKSSSHLPAKLQRLSSSLSPPASQLLLPPPP
ncbi:hypothetical protein DPMN_085092 [Dreissena polymorpha]|uniref:Uncharacterized protein n=1 Tax=Dreissena polymorpha TaxID=45954 RepID=A0A9D3YFF3_DREPO|nr:hypothetical protein DPMN_085092 [Dreissena polymorpha]